MLLYAFYRINDETSEDSLVSRIAILETKLEKVGILENKVIYQGKNVYNSPANSWQNPLPSCTLPAGHMYIIEYYAGARTPRVSAFTRSSLNGGDHNIGCINQSTATGSSPSSTDFINVHGSSISMGGDIISLSVFTQTAVSTEANLKIVQIY